jgi:hypothetical protein
MSLRTCWFTICLFTREIFLTLVFIVFSFFVLNTKIPKETVFINGKEELE